MESSGVCVKSKPSDEVLSKEATRCFFALYDPRSTAEEKDMAAYVLAEMTRNHMANLGPVDYPDRPITLPGNDNECVQKVLMSQENPERGGGEIAAEFGEWRAAVWNAEEDAKSRVNELLIAVEHYRLFLLNHPKESMVRKQMVEVLEFLKSHWDLDVEKHFPLKERVRQKILERASYRPEIMTRELGSLNEKKSNETKASGSSQSARFERIGIAV